MISKKLAKAINDQINAEMWSAYLYLSMSQDIYAKGFFLGEGLDSFSG